MLGLCKMLECFRQLVVYCYNYEIIFNYLPFNHNNILTSDFLVIGSICLKLKNESKEQRAQ